MVHVRICAGGRRRRRSLPRFPRPRSPRSGRVWPRWPSANRTIGNPTRTAADQPHEALHETIRHSSTARCAARDDPPLAYHDSRLRAFASSWFIFRAGVGVPALANGSSVNVQPACASWSHPTGTGVPALANGSSANVQPACASWSHPTGTSLQRSARGVGGSSRT